MGARTERRPLVIKDVDTSRLDEDAALLAAQGGVVGESVPQPGDDIDKLARNNLARAYGPL